MATLEETHENLVKFLNQTLTAFTRHVEYTKNVTSELDLLYQQGHNFEKYLKRIINDTRQPVRNFVDKSTNTEEEKREETLQIENNTFCVRQLGEQNIKSEPLCRLDKKNQLTNAENVLNENLQQSSGINNLSTCLEQNPMETHINLLEKAIETEKKFFLNNQIGKLLESSLLESRILNITGCQNSFHPDHNGLDTQSGSNSNRSLLGTRVDDDQRVSYTDESMTIDMGSSHQCKSRNHEEMSSSKHSFLSRDIQNDDYDLKIRIGDRVRYDNSTERNFFKCSECYETFDRKKDLTKHIFSRGHNTASKYYAKRKSKYDPRKNEDLKYDHKFSQKSSSYKPKDYKSKSYKPDLKSKPYHAYHRSFNRFDKQK